MTESRDCFAVWCGQVPYDRALDLQMKICELKKEELTDDVLLLLEHPPTITLGRNASPGHLIAREQDLQSRGVSVYNVDRGGDITFHGPGQLVGYPLLDLHINERDVHGYMRNLEESLIRLLDGYGISSGRDPGFTGVWTARGKIAAMGVHISRWITRHGFALNVNTDLSYYSLIVPCGIVGRGVTSMREETGQKEEVGRVADRFIDCFASVFNRNMIRTTPKEFSDVFQSFCKIEFADFKEIPGTE